MRRAQGGVQEARKGGTSRRDITLGKASRGGGHTLTRDACFSTHPNACRHETYATTNSAGEAWGGYSPVEAEAEKVARARARKSEECVARSV